MEPPPPRLFIPLNAENTFARVVAIYRQRWQTILGISALMYLAGWAFAICGSLLMGYPVGVPSSAADMLNGFSLSFNVNLGTSYYGQMQDGVQGNDEIQTAWKIVAYMVECAMYYCFMAVARGATVWIVVHLYLDQYPTWGAAFSHASTRLCAIFGAFLLNLLFFVCPFLILTALALTIQDSLVTTLMVIAMFIYSIVLCIVLYHTFPVVIVERLGPWRSVSRSIELSDGSKCYIFLVLLVWNIFKMLMGLLISVLQVSSIQSQGYYYGTVGWLYYVALILDIGLGILFGALDSV